MKAHTITERAAAGLRVPPEPRFTEPDPTPTPTAGTGHAVPPATFDRTYPDPPALETPTMPEDHDTGTDGPHGGVPPDDEPTDPHGWDPDREAAAALLMPFPNTYVWWTYGSGDHHTNPALIPGRVARGSFGAAEIRIGNETMISVKLDATDLLRLPKDQRVALFAILDILADVAGPVPPTET